MRQELSESLPSSGGDDEADARLGNTSSRVVSHVRRPRSISRPIKAAVIAFVSDPRCHLSSVVTRTSAPNLRTPVTPISSRPRLVTMAPPQRRKLVPGANRLEHSGYSARVSGSARGRLLRRRAGLDRNERDQAQRPKEARMSEEMHDNVRWESPSADGGERTTVGACQSSAVGTAGSLTGCSARGQLAVLEGLRGPDRIILVRLNSVQQNFLPIIFMDSGRLRDVFVGVARTVTCPCRARDSVAAPPS